VVELQLVVLVEEEVEQQLVVLVEEEVEQQLVVLVEEEELQLEGPVVLVEGRSELVVLRQTYLEL
jgi:hypothetical protein